MSLDYNTKIVRDNLVLCLDPANLRSYSGSGNTIYNISVGTSVSSTKTSGVTYNSTAPATFSATASNYIVTDYTMPSGVSFTVSLWFKRVGNFFWAAVFGNEFWNNQYGYVARIESSNLIRFSAGGDGVGISYNNANLITSNFNHYTFVKNTSGIDSYIYVNGVQVANGSIANKIINKPLLFNSRYLNDGSGYTDSVASEFSHMLVYERALTDSEVKQNYYATKRRFGL